MLSADGLHFSLALSCPTLVTSPTEADTFMLDWFHGLYILWITLLGFSCAALFLYDVINSLASWCRS